MELPPATAQRPTAAPAASNNSAPTSASRISSDFDTFLRMMTTQIQNQDPMKPMNAEEFAVQLATFSNVEQQVRTNELLEAMLARSGGEGLTAISSWIGRDVRAQMPVMFAGAPITVDPEQPTAGSRHQFVVRDAAGTEVYRQAIDATGAPVVWNGEMSGRGMAPAGLYDFSVESFDQGNLVATEPATAYARVSEVRQSSTGPTLAFTGGVEVAPDDVTAVREAGSPV